MYCTTTLPINTEDQLADIFTKPLPQETFEKVERQGTRDQLNEQALSS